MHRAKIAFIGRAARYSPNSVGKDTAILAAVRRQLLGRGYDCADIVWEDRPADIDEADAYVSMGRLQDTLNWLGDYERQWVPVVNATAGIMICKQRCLLMKLLEGDFPVPPLVGGDSYWVKRGDTFTETAADVQYAADRATADRLCEEMLQRGVLMVDVRAHITGDLVKFYGVRGTGFFRCYYPGDDGDWKLGHEVHNGKPHHYAFDRQALQQLTERVASLVCLDVYGGDCIIRPDGQPVLIDLNDWPSFSRCRDEAAQAIAERVIQRIEKTDEW